MELKRVVEYFLLFVFATIFVAGIALHVRNRLKALRLRNFDLLRGKQYFLVLIDRTQSIEDIMNEATEGRPIPGEHRADSLQEATGIAKSILGRNENIAEARIYDSWALQRGHVSRDAHWKVKRTGEIECIQGKN